MQDQCVVIVKTAPRRLDEFRSRTLGCGDFIRCWRPAELHKEAVRSVAKRTVTFIHPSTVSLLPPGIRRYRSEIKKPASMDGSRSARHAGVK